MSDLGRIYAMENIVVFLSKYIVPNNTPTPATLAPMCLNPNNPNDLRNGMVHNVIHAGDIVDLAFGRIQPAQQLFPFADFEEFANATDARAAYVVLHTKAQPPGELRGQIPGEDQGTR